MQLNNTYTVQNDGTIVLHVAQAHPNPNIFQPGPALFFVTVNGVPSNGTMVIVGSGQMGQQPTDAPSALPPSVRVDSASGKADGAGSSGGKDGDGVSGNGKGGSSSNTGTIIGSVVGVVAVLGVLGAGIGFFLMRRKRAAAQSASAPYAMTGTGPVVGGGMGLGGVAAAGAGVKGLRNSDSSAFMPLQQDNRSHAWNGSTSSLTSPVGPYRDEEHRNSGMGMSMDYDPYVREPMRSTPTGQYRY